MNSQLIQEVQERGGVDAELIRRLVEDHAYVAAALQNNYLLYQGNVAILARTFDDENKINEMLANDYIGYIIDQFGGYFIGNPIVYDFKANNYSDAEADKITEVIWLFNTRSSIADGDAELNKFTSIDGLAYRLLYIDADGEARAVGIEPPEIIYIPKVDGDGALVALRVRKSWRAGGEVILVDVYTKTMVEYWVSSKVDKTEELFFVPDARGPENKETALHMFDEVPVFEFLANKEKQNDFDKVLSLIDAYDLSFSDCQNEVEEFRLAYMVFTDGVKITDAMVKAARNTGAFSLPDEGKVSFLTKDMPESFIGQHFKQLNENILRFAKAVDMSDEKFSGAAQSGESRKWKLIGLENKAITRELKFKASLQRQYRCLTSAWSKKGLALQYEDMQYLFTRNVPIEVASSAETAQKLIGIVSRQTNLSLLPFIDDSKAELERMDDEGVDLGIENPDEFEETDS